MTARRLVPVLCLWPWLLLVLHWGAKGGGVGEARADLQGESYAFILDEPLWTEWYGQPCGELKRYSAAEVFVRCLRRRFGGLMVACSARENASGEIEVRIAPRLTPAQRRVVIGAIENWGVLEIRFVCSPIDLGGFDNYDDEIERLSTWRKANPECGIAYFNAMKSAHGGPSPVVEWAESLSGVRGGPEGRKEVPLLTYEEAEEVFSGADVSRIRHSAGVGGGAAIAIQLRDSRSADFGGVTRLSAGRQIAFVFDGKVVFMANVEGPMFSNIIVPLGAHELDADHLGKRVRRAVRAKSP